MSDKINFKLFKPFGSTVAKAVMPLGLMKDFQDDLKQIRQDKGKNKKYSKKQMKIARMAAPFDKITGADFAKLKKKKKRKV